MAFGQPFTQLPIVTPGQAGIKGAAGSQALKVLQGLGGGQFNFEPIAQQARTQFQTQTVPGLAERFTNFGGGAQRSSAFPALLGQQAAGLEEGLAGLQSQYNLKQQGLQQNLLSLLLSSALSPEFKNVENPEYQLIQQLLGQSESNSEEPNILKLLGQKFSQAVPTLLGGIFGGVPGALGGKALGSGLQALINKFF